MNRQDNRISHVDFLSRARCCLLRLPETELHVSVTLPQRLEFPLPLLKFNQPPTSILVRARANSFVPTLTMAASSGEEKTFNFFGLPRELRDRIYDHLTGASKDAIRFVKCSNYWPDEVSVECAPLIGALTLCHQFKDEYEERTRGYSTLIIKDLYCSFESPVLMSILRHLTRVSIEIVCTCFGGSRCWSVAGCGAEIDLNSHERWIRSTLNQLADLEQVNITCLLPGDSAKSEWFGSWHSSLLLPALESMVQLPRLHSLKIYPLQRADEEYGVMREYVRVPYERQERLLTEWTKSEGWREC